MKLLPESSGSHDQSIVKRKRTKRPRPSSSSASSHGGSSEFLNLESLHSPTNSTEISRSTKEDEDMANCLILLACGGSPPCSSAEYKLTSRKFAEMETTTEGKIGIYVYECKTCNRTFPSFQALGGHRASHKRPKLAADESDRKILPPVDLKKEAVDCPIAKSTILSTQLPNKFLVVESKSKVHECAICGTEFGSGQALGGHMRRHRSVVPISSSNKSVRSGTSIYNDNSEHHVNEKSRNVFDLDLNLPVESEEDNWPESFHRFESNQRSQLVFTLAAPLVDCHY